MTVPVDIGRDEAREAARAELADPAYAAAQPGPLDQAFRWLGRQVTELFRLLSDMAPGGAAGLIVLALLIFVLIVAIRLRVGPMRRGTRAPGPVFATGPRSAAEYRTAAERAVAAGQWDEAVRERFRALVRGLEERGVLDERSGRTADEAASVAGARLPALAEELRAAAVRFDDVHYGGRSATERAYRTLTALEERVRASRPVVVTR
ncbi:DUF4129 domain-containing protein [Amycolatopsis cihanbeyliensis]|uniref:Uncharacterized protein DUF4129 n=1 Tax=Amycolatopsis cihanbeyliensis TaxID=1128664 RepID=A0A542DPD5_AMYCI|nr:DUF4129 domain-containing protein [Amycolatopsis cihanbeyliensis]TQJ04916.1 uncharacterized protein DUF4129 [Amycolatopsis cihanbeyliensis]